MRNGRLILLMTNALYFPSRVTHLHLSFVRHRRDTVTNGMMNGRQSVNALNGGCADKSCPCVWQLLRDLFVSAHNRLSVTSVPTSFGN